MPVVRREIERRLIFRENARRRLLLRLIYIRNQRRRLLLDNFRRWQVRPIFQTRNVDGNYYNLIPRMRLEDPSSHQNYFRMSPETFDELLALVEPILVVDSEFRNMKAIPAGLKLGLTLRYLASGDSMVSMSYAELTGRSTVSQLIRETCNAIWTVLHAKVIPSPDAESFVRTGEGFFKKWNFPNCMGSIDGKHVVIQAPGRSGSAFYNYKHTHSIVLMAACDADYCFTCVDIGGQGRQNDSRTFSNWNFGAAILNETLPLPDPINLFGYTLPPVFVVDEAFPLRVNMLRPFPNKGLLPQKRILNYRLSRARRIIENTFGILAARWRIFRKPIIASSETVDAIVKATVCLHNLLQKLSNSQLDQERSNSYCPAHLVDTENDSGLHPGHWREIQMDGLQPLDHQGGNNHTRNAAGVRDEFMRYFWNEGSVSWQDKIFDV